MSSNHHLTSVSTSPQKNAQQFFLDTGPIWGTPLQRVLAKRTQESRAKRVVDALRHLVYTTVMATWHITVNSTVGQDSRFQSALHALVLKPIRTEFENLGFTVKPMPEHSQPALSVSHSSESAITLYRLRYCTDNIDIERVL